MGMGNVECCCKPVFPFSKKYPCITMIKSKSRRKKYRNQNKTKKCKKGGSVEVDLRQILITIPIKSAVENHKSKEEAEALLSDFKFIKGAQGLPLKRMEIMMQHDFDKLLENEPVELIFSRNEYGKKNSTKIDDIRMPLYEIINGRHRITRAIIEGREKIKATIIDS